MTYTSTHWIFTRGECKVVDHYTLASGQTGIDSDRIPVSHGCTVDGILPAAGNSQLTIAVTPGTLAVLDHEKNVLAIDTGRSRTEIDLCNYATWELRYFSH